MPERRMVLSIRPNGDIHTIYDDGTMHVLDAISDNITVQRASHVEPGRMMSFEALRILHTTNFGRFTTSRDGGRLYAIRNEFADCWFADLTPSGLQIVLGPFPRDSRGKALAAEVQVLKSHGFPCK